MGSRNEKPRVIHLFEHMYNLLSVFIAFIGILNRISPRHPSRPPC